MIARNSQNGSYWQNISRALKGLALGAALFGLGVHAAEPRSRLSEAEIKALIEQLGDKSFRQRELATQRLGEAPEAAAALHEAAAKSDNAEVRRRATYLLELFSARSRPARINAMCKRGEIDLLVDALALWKDKLAPENRGPIIAFAQRITDQLEADLGKEWPLIRRNRLWYRAQDATYEQFVKESKLNIQVQPDDVNIGHFAIFVFPGSMPKDPVEVDCSIVLRNGSMKATDVTGSFVFVNGDLEITQNLSNSIVICSGDVRLSVSPRRRGPIHRGGAIYNSVVIANGKIAVSVESPYLVQDTVVRPTEKQLLRSFAFFDLARLGLDGVSNDLHADKVRPASALAKAGLQTGDQVVGLSGCGSVASADELITALRRKSVQFEPFTIEIVRDGKKKRLEVASVPE